MFLGLYFKMRSRRADIPDLVRHFLEKYSAAAGRATLEISEEAMRYLESYDWPGNVRELESVIEHAVLFAQGDYLVPEDLPDHLHGLPMTNFRCVIPPNLTKDDIEREAIAQTLERTGGNIKKTAQILNYNRPTLYRKLRRFGLRATVPDEDVAAPATESSCVN